MADGNSYPQIPRPVWWGVSSILQRTPNTTIDERSLGTQLNVQDTAARQYVAELKRVGILSEEGRATELARRWRVEDTYSDAVTDLLKIYPESLLQVAPPENAERQKAVSWFVRGGLGEGTAKNKAATYLLIGSPRPEEYVARGDGAKSKITSGNNPTRSASPSSRRESPRTSSASEGDASAVSSSSTSKPTKPEVMPLNVNVQIHISADASGDQIESIFSAMRRYLYADAAA